MLNMFDFYAQLNILVFLVFELNLEKDQSLSILIYVYIYVCTYLA